ncbi:hypothetical protein GGS20DRAFT_568897 [Poronia punctata]|nr:hypothetical protein GGS20DRAFT_568897 [Poronia punctata]
MPRDPMSPRHRDAYGRILHIDQTLAGRELYLRPSDGRLRSLRVQGIDDAIGYGQRSWERNGRLKSRISWILQINRWTYSSVLVEGTEQRRYTPSTVFPLLLKWIPACLLLVILLIIPQNLEGIFKNGGNYDPIKYQDWRYPKVSRNRKEGEDEASANQSDDLESEPLLEEGAIEMDNMARQLPAMLQMDDEEMDEEFDDLPARHFRPRYLCFLQDGPRGPDTEYETWNVTDWTKQHGEHSSTDFVFISYTRRQFLITPEQKWRGKPEPDEATQISYRQQADADRTMVLAYGMEAARSAGKRAFWVDFECIRDADNVARGTAQSDDVFRICDIVRAAHSLVVLVGTPHEARQPGEARQNDYDAASMDEWLREWGTRLWTLPEILLVSPERRIKLYAVGGPNPPEEVAKRNIAARSVWPDAKLVRQLVDHYESSIHLTPLELVSIALECFSWRQTDQFNNGDMSYALMGLLRRRPAVVKSDKSFEAFARLSLANDSDKLLERLICMQPTRRDAPWHKIRDAWGAKLWDIEPHCQVAGIVDDRTVTLDGAFGATIQWDKLERVAFMKRATISRLIGKILLRGAPGYLLVGLPLLITAGILSSGNNSQGDDDSSAANADPSAVTRPFLIIGLIIVIPSAIISLLIPLLLLNIYQGKFWSTQAHFLGIQGIPDDLGKLERLLFGFNHGRLKWSIAGSTLSRNGLSKDGERVGLRPINVNTLDSSADDNVSEIRQEGETAFTLIDTYAMTATAFRATRPPTTVIVCGREGGMQRAILCSYDWRGGLFVREAVIRVKTLVLDRMFRVDRFRFALGRTGHGANGSTLNAADPVTAGLSKRTEQDGFWPQWKLDLSLLPFMWFVSGVCLRNLTDEGLRLSYLDSVLSSVGSLLVQPLNYWLFAKCHIGHVIGAGTLLQGFLAVIYPFIASKGGLLAINFFHGIAQGVLIPSFVYLTGLWYDGGWGQILRTVIWASGSVFLSTLPSPRIFSGSMRVSILPLVWASICILLSGYATLVLRTPEQVNWLWTSRKSTSLGDRPGSRSGAHTRIFPLLKTARTYLFGLLFLLLAVSGSFRHPTDPTARYVNPPYVTLGYVFPLVLTLFMVALFARFRHGHLPIIMILISLAFAGKLGLLKADGALLEVLIFLASHGQFAVFLAWALLSTDMVEPQALLGTLCIAFASSEVGHVISYACLAVLVNLYGGFKFIDIPPATITTFYVLALVVLLLWSVYRWWGEGRDGGRTVTPAHVLVHHQHPEASYHHIESGYPSQMSVVN